MLTKRNLIIVIIIVIVLIISVFLWKSASQKQGEKVPVSTSSNLSDTPNMYNPNDGTLLKPGETVKIRGTDTYVTEGQIGVWSK